MPEGLGPSQEEIDSNMKTRTLSDAEMLKNGAKYQNNALTPTSEQIESSRKEMQIELGQTEKGDAISPDANMTLEDLFDNHKISARLYKMLISAGITTVEQLRETPFDDLRKIHRFGFKCEAEVRDILNISDTINHSNYLEIQNKKREWRKQRSE